MEWLRLSRTHPRYARDGLNAEAMQLSPIEAWAAGVVLGPLFRPLDWIGLAAPLLSETAKTSSAAAIVLFHRPAGEDAFLSGRAFYRAWLAMERCGLKGCPMSVLADWDESRDALARQYAIPADRHIVSAFRIGRSDGVPSSLRARLPVGRTDRLEQLQVLDESIALALDSPLTSAACRHSRIRFRRIDRHRRRESGAAFGIGPGPSGIDRPAMPSRGSSRCPPTMKRAGRVSGSSRWRIVGTEPFTK